jgi:tRNA (mo5U34)-methyltransferase
VTLTVKMPIEEVRRRAESLGDWFHNLDLGGVKTAPNHFLHDYPTTKFQGFAHVIPEDLTGKSVLDIGCNGGFYSLEMKRRGAARVLGVDSDERYLAQARFAAEATGMDIEFCCLDVYDVAALGERFDLVIFMGVLYHLRHPLLALDLIHEHVAGDLLLFQSLQRGSAEDYKAEENYAFSEEAHFDEHAYPKLHFVERYYANDPTNWWIPNAACAEAMLRSSGFEVIEHPEREVYLCRRVTPPSPDGAVYPAKGPAR